MNTSNNAGSVIQITMATRITAVVLALWLASALMAGSPVSIPVTPKATADKAGKVRLTVPPASAADPVAYGANDPSVSTTSGLASAVASLTADINTRTTTPVAQGLVNTRQTTAQVASQIDGAMTTAARASDLTTLVTHAQLATGFTTHPTHSQLATGLSTHPTYSEQGSALATMVPLALTATAATGNTVALRDAAGGITATTFHGSGAQLTGIPSTPGPTGAQGIQGTTGPAAAFPSSAAYFQLSTGTCANTTALTSLITTGVGSLTITSNTLKAGGYIRVFIIANSKRDSVSYGTRSIPLYLGATTYDLHGQFSWNTTDAKDTRNLIFFVDSVSGSACNLFLLNTTNTRIPHDYSGGSYLVGPCIWPFATIGANADEKYGTFTPAFTVDPTTDLAVNLKAQFSIAHANNYINISSFGLAYYAP